MEKVIVYIDGQNFHHGLKDKTGLDSRYIDFDQFSRNVLVSKKNLVAIKYFSAKYPIERCPTRHARDADFFKALKAKGIQVIEGKFRVPKEPRLPPVEKGVDVILATSLIFDAFYGTFDCAYVVSNDTDLIPAIREIKKKFKNIKINSFAFERHSDFKKTCDYSGLIFDDVIKKYHNATNFMPSEASFQGLKDKFKKK